MRYQGRVQQWQDDRGFGFVEPNGGGPRAFLHVSEVARGSRRPAEGDLITYVATTDERGRLQAKQVRFAATRRPSTDRADSRGAATGATAVFGGLHLAGVAGLCASGRWPWAIAGLCASLSAITFVAYAWDKRAALRGRWRTPEANLHLMALLGGWPGAAFAQHALRHKSRKRAFRVVFFATVLINLVAMVLLLEESRRAGLWVMLAR